MAYEKYYLSEKMVQGFLNKKSCFKAEFKPKTIFSETASCITARYYKMAITDNYIQDGLIKISGDNQGDRVYDINGLSSCLGSNGGGGGAKTGLYAIPVLTSNRRENVNNFKSDNDTMFSLTAQTAHGIYDGYKIRRLSPRECFRLMGFNDYFDISKVSDSQAYKQAGNSIVVNVLKEIIKEIMISAKGKYRDENYQTNLRRQEKT